MPLVNSCWHNRDLNSQHGTWSTCRNGYGVKKSGDYQRPNSYLIVGTQLVGLYSITRAYSNFHTHGMPAVVGAKLGIYVVDKSALTFDLCVTKGLWDAPVIDTDFGLQTDEITSLGSLNTGLMTIGQYNWIPLNAAGIAWINQRPVEINQHESYDWLKNAYLRFYADIWVAESRTPQTNQHIRYIRLRMRRIGSPGTLYIAIKEADANHCPTGPALASATIDANTFTTVVWGDWYLIDLVTGFDTIAGTEYCTECHIIGGNTNQAVEWISCDNTKYPNGFASWSTDGGVIWASYPAWDAYFIDYEEAQVGGTKFCLRAGPDIGDTPPLVGNAYWIHFHSAQKGNGYLPLLDLTCVAGASASPAGKLVAAHLI